MWLPRTAVDHLHLVSLANQARTEVRQQLFHPVHGQCAQSVDTAWAHRMVCLRADDPLAENPRPRLDRFFATDEPTEKETQGSLGGKGTGEGLVAAGCLEDAELAQEHLAELVKASRQLETTKFWRTMCQWWKESEVLIVTGAGR